MRPQAHTQGELAGLECKQDWRRRELRRPGEVGSSIRAQRRTNYSGTYGISRQLIQVVLLNSHGRARRVLVVPQRRATPLAQLAAH